MLTPDEVRTRTHYADAFEQEDLPDLARTDFYHGVHLRAQGRDEPWDIAYRVWRAPPGGMDPVVSTIQETMGQVKPTTEITPETWLLSAEGVPAVAFVDREAKIGVMLSCGDQQCVDLETAIILAKTLYRNLERLRSITAPKPAPAKPGDSLASQVGTPAGPPSSGLTGPGGGSGPADSVGQLSRPSTPARVKRMPQRWKPSPTIQMSFAVHGTASLAVLSTPSGSLPAQG